MTPEQLAALVAALRTQRQLDMDGCEVAVSRQACDESADAIEHLQAEVARLSTPPDDAETAALVDAYRERVRMHDELTRACAELRSERAKEVRDQHAATADALTRLSHAHAAEKAKREAMEEALHTISGHVVLNNENDEELSDSALTARATLAKHGSK